MHRNIMVADDDPAIRNALKEVLESEGYVVRLAVDGNEVARRLPEIDGTCLILLDMRMPGLDGHGVIAKVRELNNPKIGVLVMTADYKAGNAISSIDVMQKPFMDIEEFLETVELHCALLDTAA